MLIEFSIANYRSFKDRGTLSMLASNIASRPVSLDKDNVFEVMGTQLLLSAAIYGANAAGKSNVIAAFNFMRHFVLASSRETQINERIPVQPFRLHTTTINQASFFEIVFLIKETQYRYGFELTSQGINTEWLYRLGRVREAMLFKRQNERIEINARNFPEGRGLEKLTRSNALFLSVVAQFNGNIASSILSWFMQITVNMGVDDSEDMVLTIVASCQMTKSTSERSFVVMARRQLIRAPKYANRRAMCASARW